MKTLLFKSLVVVASFFILGYLREDLFVNINYMLGFKLEGKNAAHYFENFIYNKIATFDYWFLYKLKWFLTLFFALIYLLLTLIFNYWFFQYNASKPLLILFVFISFLSGVFMAIGFVADNYDFTYKISRTLMGLLQSPLLFIISVPFVWQIQQRHKKE